MPNSVEHLTTHLYQRDKKLKSGYFAFAWFDASLHFPSQIKKIVLSFQIYLTESSAPIDEDTNVCSNCVELAVSFNP